MHRGDAQLLGIQRDGGFGADLFRPVPLLAEVVGERHAEAAGMGGGDEFFRIGALGVLEAGRERKGDVAEHLAVAVQLAAAAAQVTLPAAVGGALDRCHARLLEMNCCRDLEPAEV